MKGEMSVTEQKWIEKFADHLTDILNEYGYTQREFADAIGISEVSLSRYLTRRRMPSVPVVINMAMELGMSLDDLIDFGERVY